MKDIKRTRTFRLPVKVNEIIATVKADLSLPTDTAALCAIVSGYYKREYIQKQYLNKKAGQKVVPTTVDVLSWQQRCEAMGGVVDKFGKTCSIKGGAHKQLTIKVKATNVSKFNEELEKDPEADPYIIMNKISGEAKK